MKNNLRILIVNSKELLIIICKNSVLLMVSGSIIGFLIALSTFFIEDFILFKGNSIVACESCNVKEINGIFNSHQNFLTWIMLFVVHTGAALGLGLAALQNILLKTLKHLTIAKSEIILSLVLVIFMIIISSTSYVLPFDSGKYYFWPETPLNHQWAKIIFLLAISITSASIGVMGLILIGCICKKLLSFELNEDIILNSYQVDVYLYNEKLCRVHK